MPKKPVEPPKSDRDKILATLNAAYADAIKLFEQGGDTTFGLPSGIIRHLDVLTNKCESASTAFTNILTGLAIKCALPDLDVRYHQVQIQAQSRLGKSWFTHRSVSEKIIYPWLMERHFSGAKSGWQTRTFERPKPYTRNFEENIAYVKDSFLEVYESTEESEISVILSELRYLLLKQIEARDSRIIDLATPTIDEISKILRHIEQHIRYRYSSRGASRLPVLATYAILQLISGKMERYSDLTLRPLGKHSAADSQTGSAGDIEFFDASGTIVEAFEIKHDQKIEEDFINYVERKISPFQLDRYYILTTSEHCRPEPELVAKLSEVRKKIGCQVIVNGVFPTIQYYLRLVGKPQKFYKLYTDLLIADSEVHHEHLVAWNDVILNSD